MTRGATPKPLPIQRENDKGIRRDEERRANLSCVIISAGPVELAAAAHLVRQGESPLLFEAGATVGASMLQWGHVRLFSPWRYVIDQQAQALLAEQGWQTPNLDGCVRTGNTGMNKTAIMTYLGINTLIVRAS